MVIYLFSISLDLKCKNYTSLFFKAAKSAEFYTIHDIFEEPFKYYEV